VLQLASTGTGGVQSFSHAVDKKLFADPEVGAATSHIGFYVYFAKFYSFPVTLDTHANNVGVGVFLLLGLCGLPHFEDFPGKNRLGMSHRGSWAAISINLAGACASHGWNQKKSKPRQHG